MADRIGRIPAQRYLVRLVELGHTTGRRAVVEYLVFVVVVGLIGVVDHATGLVVTYGVFYLVPVAAATIRCGTGPASWLALLSATTWVMASRPGNGQATLLADVLNLAFRSTILLFVVTVLGTVIGALEQARASDARSREFLRFAAHQLRTPATSVSVTAQDLLASGQHREDEEALLRLVSESTRTGRLVASMLRFTRLEQGDPPSATTVPIGEGCAAEVRRRTDLAAPLRFDLVVDDGAADLEVNAEALQEALDVLLDNAARHARARVVVRITVTGDRAEVRVRDDGAGVPRGAEERMFEPFVTLDEQGGSGLGLTIARRLLEVQDGSLRYEDGAFVLALPFTTATSAGRAPGRS